MPHEEIGEKGVIMVDPDSVTQPRLTERFIRALEYATHLHWHQLRKGGNIPYISHLISVAALVLEDGGDEDGAIAALLHDAIEDQGGATIRDDIRQQFGDRVLQIVEACTESDQIPKPPWKQRKMQALAQLRRADPAVQRVMIADKLHNLRSIWADQQRCGDQVWQRFNASRTEVLWFYTACLDAVRDRNNSPMVTELQTLLQALSESVVMAKPTFKITDHAHANGFMARLVEFEIPGGVTTPEQFWEAVQEIEDELIGTWPILINGRGPIWGYGMLFHVAHPSPAIATYDPRLGYVIIQTHDQRFKVGQILNL